MRRVAAEAAIAVTTATTMAALVLILGNTLVRPVVEAEHGAIVEPHNCAEMPLSVPADSGITGTARLCTDRGLMRTVLQARGLREGDVYTAWLAYFERPATCFHTPCGFIDLRGSEPVGMLGRIDGAIAPASRDLDLHGEFRDLHTTPGSQVTVLVLSHGAVDDASGQARARQLLTPQMFELGAPLAGLIGDPTRSQLHAQAIFTVE